MNKIVNGVANDFEFDMPPISAYGSINVDELNQIIERFKKIPDYDTLIKDNNKKDKEIERLNNEIKALLKENGNKEKLIIKQNNIIGAIEKYLLELRLTDVPGKTIVYRLLDKLKALKKGKDND
jgi:hypothetical protein